LEWCYWLIAFFKNCLILNPLSIGYLSGEARGRRQEAKGGINNQFLITEFSIIHGIK
jgi:hypothetical protein